jgi:hypothetical protein
METAIIDSAGLELVISPPLPSSLATVVKDLSGAIHNGGDLLRHVPALSAAVQTLGGTGPEKLALVQRAAHVIVDLYIPTEDRSAVHQLVDGILPSVVRAILDVSKGRVKIGEAVATAAMEVMSAPETQAAALGLLAQCLACLRPRPATLPQGPSAAEPKAKAEEPKTAS